MTGRRDPSARDAVEYAADAGVLPAPPPVPPSPDCTAGKHSACVGETWDAYDDVPADCPCACHEPGGWGERDSQPTRHDRPTTRPERHEPRTNL